MQVFNEFFQTEAAKTQSRCRKVLQVGLVMQSAPLSIPAVLVPGEVLAADGLALIQVEAIASLALGDRSASTPPVISPTKPQLQAGAPLPGRPAMVRASSSAGDVAPAGAKTPVTVAALAAVAPAPNVLPADRASPAASLSNSRSPLPLPVTPMRAAGISQGPPVGQWRMPAAASLARGLSAPQLPTEARTPLPLTPAVPATGSSNYSQAHGQPGMANAARAGTPFRVSSPQQEQPQRQQQGLVSPASARQPPVLSPSKSVSRDCVSPLGSPLRTPWALHIAEVPKLLLCIWPQCLVPCRHACSTPCNIAIQRLIL